MEIPNVHAPCNEDDVEFQSVIPVALEDGIQLPFKSSFDDSFWSLSGYEHGDPLINELQTYLPQPGNLHQNFMRNEEHQRLSPLLSFNSEWFQHGHSIPGLDISLHDARGNQYNHGSLLLASDGQDAMTVWEDTHVSNSDDPHHPALVGGDMRDSGLTPPPTPMTPSGGPNILRCQDYVQGQPCGVLIEGGFPGILEHFACMHVRPRMSANDPPEYWICHWGGKCDRRIRKEGFRRHVLGHLVRWKCSTCSSTYSRDDSARKHAKDCGDGRIVMQPRLEVCSQRL